MTSNFTADPYGNLTTIVTPPLTGGGNALVSTATYDLANRLTGFTPAGGPAATFTLDALGRHRTKTAGAITDTYGYVGSGEVIAAITSSTGAAIRSIVDPTGARLAVSTSAGGFGWTLADLHANLAGYASLSGGSVSDAVRYDPWGETRASVASGLPRPFAYQGRLALSATPGAEAYDFLVRAYHPDTATFRSADDLAGSALDPTSFNRYLYAHANPATLIDPSTRRSEFCGDPSSESGAGPEAANSAHRPARASR